MGQELVPSMDQRNVAIPAAEQQLDLRVYLNVLRRRYLYLLLPAVGIFAAVCLVTFFLLPSMYQATAKILVISQLIPTDLAASTVSASATERIEIIKQRLTTRDNLLSIAQKYDLYPKQRTLLSPSEVVEWIQDATVIEQIEVGDTPSQRARQGTEAVGFSLSFNYSDPVLSARVANELLSSILQQNIQARSSRAAETSKFFHQQVTKLQDELSAMEKRIADFKKANEAASPETLNDRRSRLSELKAQIAAVDQMLTFGTGQSDSVEAQAQLKGLKGRLLAAQQQLKNATEQRASLEGLFKKGYVTRSRLMDLDNRIAQLQGEIEQLSASITVALNKVDQSGGNPEFLPKRREELVAQAVALEETIAKTPEAESGLNALLREYENLRTDYREAKSKTTVATTGEQMEEDRQAERFEVIEQAAVPTEPSSPDRPRILLAGAFMSIAAGIGMVILMEVLDKSIRSARDLERLLQTRPLIAIPYVTTAKEIEKQNQVKRGSLLIAIVLVGLVVFFVHFFYQPLDVLWFRVMQLPRYYGLV